MHTLFGPRSGGTSVRRHSDGNHPELLVQVAQLHHELNLKDELLQFYTNAAEESEDESSSSPT